MPKTIEYYFATVSPWTYLGHQRLRDIAQRCGAQIEPLPVDLGQVFPVSGGLPLGKRAPQRQAYRLLELRRFSDHLGLPLHLQPSHFPVNGDEAARITIAVLQHEGAARALDFAGAVLRAVWAEERNIADPITLGAILTEQSLPTERQVQAAAPEIAQTYAANTTRAIERGVFGAPSCIVDGELFWGQDRLDFVERKLKA